MIINFMVLNYYKMLLNLHNKSLHLQKIDIHIHVQIIVLKLNVNTNIYFNGLYITLGEDII